MGRILLLFVFVITAYLKLVAHEQPQSLSNTGKDGETIVYLVRHAEKDLSNPNDKDPDLTPAGQQRAEALNVLLQEENIAGFFSTPYKRTKQTLAPVAKGRPIQFYDAHDFTNLKDRILTEFAGKTVVVAGHSNTLLPIIEAFGPKKPVAEIKENQYDNLFILKISRRGKATVQAKKFGALSV